MSIYSKIHEIENSLNSFYNAYMKSFSSEMQKRNPTNSDCIF